jgi:hypothetical protein
VDEKNIQNQAQDAEEDDVDHVDLRMSCGNDKRIAHQVRYVLKDEEKEKNVQDPNHPGE